MPEVQESVLKQPKEETRQDAQGLTPSIVRTSDTLPQSKHHCQVGNPLRLIRKEKIGEFTRSEWSDGSVLFSVKKDKSKTIKQSKAVSEAFGNLVNNSGF